MKIVLILTFICFSIKTLSKEPIVYQFVGSSFPNILTYDKDGALTGSAVKIIERASKKLNFKYEITLYPWVRATEMVKQGKADILIGPYKTVERENFMNFTDDHFYEDQIILVTLRDKKVKWSGDLSSLVNLKVGVVRGWALGKIYEKYKSKLQVTYAESTDKLLQMLQLERLDIIIIHKRSYTEDIKTDFIDITKFKILSPELSSQKGYFAFSKRKELSRFMKAFNNFIGSPSPKK